MTWYSFKLSRVFFEPCPSPEESRSNNPRFSPGVACLAKKNHEEPKAKCWPVNPRVVESANGDERVLHGGCGGSR